MYRYCALLKYKLDNFILLINNFIKCWEKDKYAISENTTISQLVLNNFNYIWLIDNLLLPYLHISYYHLSGNVLNQVNDFTFTVLYFEQSSSCIKMQTHSDCLLCGLHNNYSCLILHSYIIQNSCIVHFNSISTC